MRAPRHTATLALCSWILLLGAPFAQGQTSGPEFVPAPSTLPDHSFVWAAWARALRQSAELWQTVGDSLGRRLQQGGQDTTTFLWPMWDAADAPTLLPTDAISNFVDHNPRRSGGDLRDPSAITDFNCGQRTYDGHRGLDIFSWPFNRGKVGTGFVVARAAADGVIVAREDGHPDRSCDLTAKPANYVILEHADGSRSLYWHLATGSVIDEPIGSSVLAGEVVGEVASSGFSTGPHLHFEVRGSSLETVDPYSGACNALNSESHWRSQPAYRNPRVAQISTHSAEPDFTSCPLDEQPHVENLFTGGEAVFLVAFLRDLQNGDGMEWRLYQPDGALWESLPIQWQGEDFSAGWFWFSRTLPDLPGTWRYQYDYAGGTYETTFHVGQACQTGERTGCAGEGRFLLEVIWQDFDGEMGYGRAIPLTDDTVSFWFFRPENLELVVKVLDARAINQAHWVFYGALTNVKYILRIFDTHSGEVRYYTNPSRRFASAGDIGAFPSGGGPDRSSAGSAAQWASFTYALDAAQSSQASPSLAGATREEQTLATTGGACLANARTLCLNGDRFAVTATWRDFGDNSGSATANEVTADTGTFWFFGPDNVELILKVLDAREINGKFWVFYGALSNVEYEITVTDTLTGQVKTYFNPLRSFASVGDTTAF